MNYAVHESVNNGACGWKNGKVCMMDGCLGNVKRDIEDISGAGCLKCSCKKRTTKSVKYKIVQG